MTDNSSQEVTISPLLIKALIIAALAVVLLLPARLIQQIIGEREGSWKAAVEDVSSKWAHPQTIIGPVISVPYTATLSQPGTAFSTSYVHILPDRLNVSGHIEPEIRHRGIYDVALYKTHLRVSGSFGQPDLRGLSASPGALRWTESIISVGITDMRGINQPIQIRLGPETLSAQPGVKQTDIVRSGISAVTGLVSDTIGEFSFDLSLNGSAELSFAPVGKTTNVSLNSPWSHPSFDGAFLPDSHHITSQGFKASWTILDLNRNFPQVWEGRAFDPGDWTFSVRLFNPVDTYQKTWRATRYAILFIALTFLIYFFAEARNGSRIHPVQYGLVGATLCIFYTLLISISEHMRFETAYLIGSIAVVGILTLFTAISFRKWQQPVLMFCTLGALYGFLYTLLQINDYALLIGSIGLFVLISAFLLLSRRINWYARKEAQVT